MCQNVWDDINLCALRNIYFFISHLVRQVWPHTLRARMNFVLSCASSEAEWKSDVLTGNLHKTEANFNPFLNSTLLFCFGIFVGIYDFNVIIFSRVFSFQRCLFGLIILNRSKNKQKKKKCGHFYCWHQTIIRFHNRTQFQCVFAIPIWTFMRLSPEQWISLNDMLNEREKKRATRFNQFSCAFTFTQNRCAWMGK